MWGNRISLFLSAALFVLLSIGIAKAGSLTATPNAYAFTPGNVLDTGQNTIASAVINSGIGLYTGNWILTPPKSSNIKLTNTRVFYSHLNLTQFYLTEANELEAMGVSTNSSIITNLNNLAANNTINLNNILSANQIKSIISSHTFGKNLKTSLIAYRNISKTIPYGHIKLSGKYLPANKVVNFSVFNSKLRTLYIVKANIIKASPQLCVDTNLGNVCTTTNQTTPVLLGVPVINGHFGLTQNNWYPLNISFKSSLLANNTASWNVTIKDITNGTVLFNQIINSNDINITKNYKIPVTHQVEMIIETSGNQNYTSLIEDPVAAPTGIQAYVPITISYNGLATYPNPFQQIITVNALNYTSYIAFSGNIANFEYFYANGTIIPAWIESNSSNIITTWVKLSNTILPNTGSSSATNTIYLGFASKSTNLLSNSGTSGIGEAPQLSSTYGQYDDGASVFNIYFNGNTPTSDFVTGGGDTVTQQTGVTLPNGATGNVLRFTTGSSEAVTTVDMFTATSLQNSPNYYISEASFQSDGSGIDMDWGFAQNSGTATSNNAIFVGTQFVGAYFDQAYISGGSRYHNINSQGSTTTSWRYSSLTYNSPSSFYAYIAPQLYSTSGGYSGTVSTNPIASISPLYWGWWGDVGASGHWVQFNWVRVRAYPPNGVMPSVSFSSVHVVPGYPLLTITPNPTTYGSSTLVYVNTSTASNTTGNTIELLINGNVVAGPTTSNIIYTFNSLQYGAGSYTFNAYDENTLKSVISTLTVNKNSTYPFSLSLTPSQNYIYNGTGIKATYGLSTFKNQLTGTLYLNGNLINSTTASSTYTSSASAGTYVFTFNTVGNANYTPKTVSGTITISKNSTYLFSLSLSPSQDYFYNGTGIKATYDIYTRNNQLAGNLYLNNVLIIANTISGNYISSNSVGTYVFTFNTIGNANYTPASITKEISIVNVPSSFPSNIIYFTAIPIYNNQSVATPSPFQQTITINALNFTPYMTYNDYFTNFEFFYANGTVIPAWIESNVSNTITAWVKLTPSIAPDNSLTIYLGFASKSTNLLSNSGTSGIGEAPQLSSTYGQYDDGASVFNNYWNFAGTSCPSGWTCSGATINNGITIPYSSYAYTTSNFGYNTNTIVDFYGNFPAATSAYNAAFGFVKSGTGNAGVDAAWTINTNNKQSDTTNAIGQTASSTAYTTGISGGVSATGYNIYSIYFTPSFVKFSYNYGAPTNFTTTLPTSAYPLGGINTQGSQAAPGPFYWLRTRAYPPNGVMPSVSFSSVQAAVQITKFIETGLPSGAKWNVTYDSILNSSTTNTIIFSTTPGNYLFNVPAQTVNSVTYESSPSSGYLVAGNTTTIAFKPFSVSISTPSNTVVDAGQYETFTATVYNGTSPYTYNILVVNSITPAVIAHNDLVSGSSATSISYTFQTTSADVSNSPEEANVVVTDSFPATVNSVYSSTFTINPAPAITLAVTPSNSIIYGSPFTINAVISGGTGNFAVYWYLNGNSIAPTIVSQNAITSNTMMLPAAGNYVYMVEANDIGTSSVYTLIPATNTIIVAKNNTLTASSSGNPGSAYYSYPVTITFTGTPTIHHQAKWSLYVNGALYGTTNSILKYYEEFSPPGRYNFVFNLTSDANYTPYTYTTSLLISYPPTGAHFVSTTVTTTSITTSIPTTIPPSQKAISITSNISSSSPLVLSLPNTRSVLSIYTTSAASAPIVAHIANVTQQVSSLAKPWPNYTLINAVNVSIKTTAPITAFFVEHYPCSIPSDLVAPYIFKNNTWLAITNYTVNATACTVSFYIPSDPIVAIFEKSVPTTTTTSIATTIPTTIPTTVYYPSPSPKPRSSIVVEALALIIIVIIIILVLLYYYKLLHRRHHGFYRK